MIRTIHLFSKLDDELIAMLKTLSDEEWRRPTLAKEWTVKDIAAHLLDGNLRMLSFVRDNFVGDPPGALLSYQDLVTYLDNLNAVWVNAMRRVSPKVLTELLQQTGKHYFDVINRLNPESPAIFPVDWAGEKESKNWFHIAREYTEKWHHQAQIRETVNRPALLSREFFYPVMDTFMRALPHAYRSTPADDGTFVVIHVSGEQGGHWNLLRKDGRWQLSADTALPPSTEIIFDPITAWHLFTKGITPQEASQKVIIKGIEGLGEPVLGMISVMATRKS